MVVECKLKVMIRTANDLSLSIWFDKREKVRLRMFPFYSNLYLQNRLQKGDKKDERFFEIKTGVL